MRANDIKQEIAKLNLAEKLLLIEDVWDSIAESNSDIPLPEWQKNELNNRFQEYKSGRLNLHSWQSVHEDIKNNYK